MNTMAVQPWRPLDFGNVPSFSRRQAAAWNVCSRAFAGARWQNWIAEGLSGFFERSAGFEIRMRQKHAIDPHQPESVFTSDANELSLGREESCDIRLAPRSVGNRHARIFTQAGKCYIEDLGSALGTFLNQSRLAAHQPALVKSGDQFAVFPYTFTIEITEKWIRDAQVDVSSGSVSVLHEEDLHRAFPADQIAIGIHAYPSEALLRMSAARAFLERLSARLIAPLCPDVAARIGLASVDSGFLELLVAAVLERMNRDLRFPLQATLAPEHSRPRRRDGRGGLVFSFAIRIGELTGTFRLLTTDDSLELLGRSVATRAEAGLPEISWQFPLSAGYVEFAAAELAAIELGDVVLLISQSAMLFPNGPERGWRLRPKPGNLSQASVDNYFERGSLSEKETELEGTTAPNFAGLPIRMHAIIGEKEMTWAEANLLVPGAIVELDKTKSDPVRIALNGKIAGTGELVEVDGQLGVRILTWKTP
jgi:type III secretion system YscQ/HrcQ family protein